MTVGQLIAELQEYDYNMEVIINGFGDIVELNILDTGYLEIYGENND